MLDLPLTTGIDFAFRSMLVMDFTGVDGGVRQLSAAFGGQRDYRQYSASFRQHCGKMNHFAFYGAAVFSTSSGGFYLPMACGSSAGKKLRSIISRATASSTERASSLLLLPHFPMMKQSRHLVRIILFSRRWRPELSSSGCSAICSMF